MRNIIVLLLLGTFAFAKYSVYFNGIKSGEIENLENSLKENFLEIKVTNSFASLLLQKDKLIFYNEQYMKQKNKNDVKYKKDKYQIISLLQKVYEKKLIDEKIKIEKNKYISIKPGDNYEFTYKSNGKIKSEGFFEVKNGELVQLIETLNNIKISKI
jgi:hypothetical protein